MTSSSVSAIIAALVQATPPPPTGTLDPSALATVTTALLEKRQPLIVRLTEAMAAGAILDPESRERLEAVAAVDAAWRKILESTREVLGRQLMLVSRQEAREDAAQAAPTSPLLDILA